MAKISAREGELYKVYRIEDHTFEIRYGYYEESERGRMDPLPIFPDLVKNPVYTKEGRPIVSVVQPPCRHYRPRDKEMREDWCGDCMHYSDTGKEIAVCDCKWYFKE